MRDKSIKLITTFLVLLFLSSIFNFSPTDTRKNENFQITIKENKTKTSQFWNLTGSLISIDDNIWDKTWSYTAWFYDWCSGSGNWADPYIIENVTIDGQRSGNCIDVRNSDKYFIIRNCTLYNSGSVASIYFHYANNGKIIDNNCSNNKYTHGIILDSSNNNTLSGNTLINNRYEAIYLALSDNNRILENIVINNTNGNGIYLSVSDNNKLLENIVINNHNGIRLYMSDNNTLLANNASNTGYGISLRESNNNIISGNTANNNSYGISLSNNSNNTISGNTANNNTQNGITLWYSNNNIFSGNTVNDNSYDGIYLQMSDNNTLSGNIASSNNENGIHLESCYNNTLSGNTASNNNENGIYLEFSDKSTLSGNTAYNNYEGVYLMYSDNSTLSGNTAYNNYKGINIYDSNNSTLSGNIANNNTNRGIGISWCYNNKISRNTASNNDHDGIQLFNCFNSTLSGNTVNNSYYGIHLMNRSNNNTLSGNTVNNNSYGIHLSSSNNNTLSGNTVDNNSYGIHLYWYSDNNTLSGNRIRNNKHYGAYITGGIYSIQNLFFNNSFINNSVHAYDGGINNYWDNGTMGNYWDDYNGEDFNNDGIGDTRYNISGSANSQDNYPIWWDSIVISIYTPNSNEFFGTIAPSFAISIDKGLARTTWYTIDNGLKNITFTGSTGTVEQIEWDKISSGFVTLTFYANNTLGVISSSQVVIGKDVANPIVVINSPKPNDLIGVITPSFNVEVTDANLDTMWYTIDGGITNTTFTTNGTINQELWDTLSNGTATITFFANDSAGNEAFNSVIVRVDKIIPSIIIHSPIENQLFGTNAPSPMFNISVDDIFHDKKWYTLNQDSTKYFFLSSLDYINQTAWTGLLDGSVTIRFYANDSAGNIGFSEVTIRKDINAPIITINNPQNNDIFGATAPNFHISIDELNLDTVWYSLNDGTNITFTGLTGIINQTLWDALPEGNVVIKFYANDTLGRIGFSEVTVTKDVTAPIITINNPQNNDVIGGTALNFNITIEEPNLDKIWYSLNGSTNITFTGLTGTINQALWDALPEGNVVIKFYANDTLGRIGFQEVIIVKKFSQHTPPVIPGYDLLFLLGIISAVTVIIIKKRVNDLK